MILNLNMRNFLTTVFLLVIISNVFGQQTDLTKIAERISNEGNALYRSEWASWYGTDIFTEKCKSRRAIAGGYISYDTGAGLNNIFFLQGANPVVLATTSFEYDLNSNNYKLDTTDRKLTPYEMELYKIRKTAVDEINKDTLFKSYNHTNLNPVPIIIDKKKKVYILTGTNDNGVVIFGNDYLISFDDNDRIIDKKKLHKGIIADRFGKGTLDSGKVIIASMHTHLPEFDKFITATDICTLRLYEKFTTWKQYIIMSKNYVSIWDCERDKLTIMTYEAWQKSNPLKSALKNDAH